MYLDRGALKEQAEIIPLEPETGNSDEGNVGYWKLPQISRLFN